MLYDIYQQKLAHALHQVSQNIFIFKTKTKK